jgi:hypothetical protein
MTATPLYMAIQPDAGVTDSGAGSADGGTTGSGTGIATATAVAVYSAPLTGTITGTGTGTAADGGAVVKYMAVIPDAGKDSGSVLLYAAPLYAAPMTDAGTPVVRYMAAQVDAGSPVMDYMAPMPVDAARGRDGGMVALYAAPVPVPVPTTGKH